MTTALNVTDAINTGLFGKLNSDSMLLGLAPGGIHNGAAPNDAVFPLCEFQYLAGKGHEYTLSQRVRVDCVYVVKGVSKDDGGATAGQIAARADLLLTDGILTLGVGWGVLYCRREGDIDYQEENSGLVFYHRGGRYRIQVQPA